MRSTLPVVASAWASNSSSEMMWLKKTISDGFDPFWSIASMLGDFGRKPRFGGILTHSGQNPILGNFR